MHRATPWMNVKALAAGSVLLAFSSPLIAGTDYNNDGLCDIWQQFYDAWDLVPGGDEDNDGCTNLTESIAGTNPRNPADCNRVGDVLVAGNSVVLSIQSKVGKGYQLISSNTPSGPTWTNRGDPVTGDGSVLQFVTPMDSGTGRAFYRIRTTDQDTDNDGVSDWAEEITGTSPTLASSPSNASGGTASDGDVMASLFALSMTQLPGQEDALEKEGTAARLRLVRPVDKSGARLTLAFTTAPNPDSTKGSTSGNDYTLAVSQAGGMVTGTATGTVTIPAGASEMDIIVNPVADSSPEVPELLTLNVLKPGIGSGTVPLTGTATIIDADPAEEANRTLFVAYLGREAGVNTTATGIATALVNGDNDEAAISLTFSNLTSPQNTAYLRVDSDLEIINVGFGQVSGRQWEIRAAQTKFTDQAMLTALHAGQLYISVTTADNPTGEIRGYFNKAAGSSEFTFNSNIHDAPAPGSENWANPTAGALERDIWRFLNQCTYGGTEALYQEVLAEVTAAISGGGTYLDGYEAWLDKQMDPEETPNANLMQLVIAADNEEFIMRGNKPIFAGNDPKFGGVTYTVTYDTFGNPTINTATDGTYNNNHPFHNNRRREMWTLAMGAKAQVRQRMAQALSEILVISEMDQTVQDRHYAAASYWDMIADGAFGKFRDLLEKVTYSPMMGIYLSHIRNRATYVSSGVTIHPDENYAREIMQLFSIGLVLRHPDGSLVLGSDGLPIPTYDNDDITELARVLTGFCHGVRHQAVNIQRFNGLQMTASNNQRVGSNLEVQGGANTAGVSFTSFGEGGGDRWFQGPWIYPMKTLGRVGSTVYHDFGQKILLEGKHGETLIPAQSLAGRTDAQTHAMVDVDLRLAHNLLAGDPTSGSYNGHNNTPINISRWLIQRLTTSNPSAGYLYRVSNVYRNSNGNLGAVMKAILLDYEARSLELADTSISHGRMKEPLVHFMAVLRSLKASTGLPLTHLRDMQVPFSSTDSMSLPGYSKSLPAAEVDKYVSGTTRIRMPDQTTSLGQSPLRAPSVFNWFLPDYVVPGPMAEAGLFSPEMQIASETSLVNRINRLWTFTWASLEGMATFPGTGVDDIISTISSRAGPQVKVLPPGATAVANNFLPLTNLTFTPSNWSSPQTVTVAAVDDLEIEGSHFTSIFHRAISTDANYSNRTLPAIDVALMDNEAGAGASVVLTETADSTLVVEGGATDTYSLHLTAAPGSNVTVFARPMVTGANNATQVTVSPASLTFTPANYATPQFFTVTAVNDTTNEGPHVGIIGHHIETADAIYTSVHAPSLQATVADNEQSTSVAITQTQNSTIVLEGGYTDTFRVTMRRTPTSTLTFTPAANSQVSLSPSTLTFTSANYNIPQTVTVTAVDDAVIEGTHSTTISYTSSGGGYSVSANVPVTINDNDGGGVTIVESGGTTTATEGAALTGLDSYTIRLNSQPTANVTVEITPQRHTARMSNHAKAMGYFASDLPASNLQKDTVLLDYSDLISLYNTTFLSAGGISGTSSNNTAAHFAATVAIVNKFDLWWCGGQLQAQLPDLTLEDLANPAIVHSRKSIVAALLYGYSTTQGTGTPNNIRDRCRIAAYLVSISPQSFTAR
ncbi:DUF1800 family protein [Prosthecobacter sp. SYSU 5D2]|uniref:DUF1800 family protein n=1 Tax=Prosthecobacter sp. SYSU 5D2 TaxID=3134134 RepID=UPI0031FEF3F4